LTGVEAILFSSKNTSEKDGLVEFAERIPVMRAGIPADLLVVDDCLKTQDIAP
jgi:hypothetical protein